MRNCDEGRFWKSRREQTRNLSLESTGRGNQRIVQSLSWALIPRKALEKDIKQSICKNLITKM